MRKLDVEFRGEEMTVVVDQYDYDPETNGLEVEWHFEGIPPHVHNKLSITPSEEEAILAAISEEMGSSNELDEFDYHHDR